MIPEWMLIAATLAGPVLAVQAQKWIERSREPLARKQRLFQSLMATRAERVSAEHVRALNMIEIEFYDSKSGVGKDVLDKWRIYLDHLSEDVSQAPQAQLDAWTARGTELFIDLLFAMAQSLGYSFDRVLLKRGIYHPRAHGENEIAGLQIRDSLVRILSGEKPLPVTYIATKSTTDQQ